MADQVKAKVVSAVLLMVDMGNSSEDESDESDDDLSSILPAVYSCVSHRQNASRIEGYFETVVPRYSDGMFKAHFRMKRESVEKFCLALQDSAHVHQKQQGGRPMVDLGKQVCIFLWYSASKEPYRTIADRFDVTESTVLKIIRRVTLAIHEVLLKLIAWPQGTRCREVMNGFKEMKGLERVMGAIDGTHIPISGREECNENYINRKGFASIIMQGICDHERRFTDVYTGWPGSVHDARVFENSDIKARIEEDPISMVPEGAFLLGDGAYTLETYMMVPYKDHGNFTPLQQKYNYVQSATRNIIERAFALLKSRFCRLKLVEVKNLEHLCEYLIAVCIVHNFCIDEELRLGDSEPDFFIEPEEEVNNFVCYGSSSKDAERKRKEIAGKL